MGDESGVSRSIGLVKESRVAELERQRERLLKSAIGGINKMKMNFRAKLFHYSRPDPFIESPD